MLRTVGSSALFLMMSMVAGAEVDVRLLATQQTSTMERELNEAARDGFFLVSAQGGETEFGGRELVAIVERNLDAEDVPYVDYLVLATNRTSTMADELYEAGRRGFVMVAQTVYETSFGGQEVVVIMERNLDGDGPICEYDLLATQRTSTMEKELNEAARRGFIARGVSVAETAYGGNEVVVVVERCVARE